MGNSAYRNKKSPELFGSISHLLPTLAASVPMILGLLKEPEKLGLEELLRKGVEKDG